MKHINVITWIQQSVRNRDSKDSVIGKSTAVREQFEVDRLRSCVLMNRADDITRDCPEHRGNRRLAG